MNEHKSVVRTLQWCPTVQDVVTLEIEGKVEGKMVYGEVIHCYTSNLVKCKTRKSSFCWLNRRIFTLLVDE